MTAMQNKRRSLRRLQDRLIAHHLPLFGVSAVSVAILFFTRDFQDILSRFSFATSYPALALIGLTLLIGPWNVLLNRRNPVSSDLRRDVGIWAGILSLLHSVVGQCVHIRGRPWLYYVYRKSEGHTVPFRHDMFGFANYTGLIAALIVMALLATSNDSSLGRLGAARWKQLQRWNYGAATFAAVHTFAYQSSGHPARSFVFAVVLGVLVTMVFQVAGFAWRRANTRAGKQA